MRTSRSWGVEKLPNLGWVLESDGRNVRQAAYQWQLSETADFSAPLYDSGRVESDESAHVPCRTWPSARAGSILSGHRYGREQESAWASGSFLTGMASGGWQATFISARSGKRLGQFQRHLSSAKAGSLKSL